MIENRKIEQSLHRLRKWSEKPQWVDFLDETYFNHLNYALRDLDITEDEIFDCLSPEETNLMNGVIYEDFITEYFGEDGELNVISDFLKRRGLREPPIARQFLKSLLDSTMSIYEVVELDLNGPTMKVRDLLQKDMTLAIQKSSDMERWAIWDCVGARVVSMSGKHYFTNGTLRLSRGLSKVIVESTYKIARHIQRKIIKRARIVHKNSTEIPFVSQEVLCAAVPIATMLTHAWLEETIELEDMPLPILHNTDHEEIIICEVQFPIRGDLTELIAKLDEFEEFERLEEENAWSWFESKSSDHWLTQNQKDSPESQKKLISSKYDIESTATGYVSISSKSLVLSVNSAERADRGKVLLESRLGNLVGQSLTSYHDLEQIMKQPPDSTDLDFPIMDEEEIALQNSYIKEHYYRVLDEPVPMLGNKTPRKAAATKKGRSEVVEWLKSLENFEHRCAQKDGIEPLDLTWMWEDLKIEMPR